MDSELDFYKLNVPDDLHDNSKDALSFSLTLTTVAPHCDSSLLDRVGNYL